MESETVPVFRGNKPNGCKWQVSRARNGVQTIADVLHADALLLDEIKLENMIRPQHDVGCDCRIAENGLIDKSLCRKIHVLYPIPFLARWCDVTTCRLRGGGHLLYWSGWARPSVVALLGRHPTREQVAHLIARSDKSVHHAKFKFSHTPRFDDQLSMLVYDVRSDFRNGMQGIKWLRSGPPESRFGQHSLAVELSIGDV